MAANADPAGRVSESTVRDDGDGDDIRDAEQLSESTEAGDEDTEVEFAARPSPLRLRLPIAVGLIAVTMLGGLGGWLGYRAYEVRQAQQQHDLYLQVGRQVAVNLTTIDYNQADADVQRILESATGTFHDDFQQRAPAFIEVVKKAQSKTDGTITEAGVELEQADQAQVLVAVSVKSSNAGAPEQQPRAWRMRITVQRTGNTAKAADVAFVP